MYWASSYDISHNTSSIQNNFRRIKLSEIDNQISVRNLKDSQFGTPLQDFEGTYVGFETEINAKFNKTIVVLNFKDIQVHKSTEPYPFPIAQIRINFSQSKGSAWGIFAGSLVKLLKPEQDIKDASGMHIRLQLTPGHKFGTDKTQGSPTYGQEIIRDCWEVVGVSGESAKAADGAARALELLDGKTAPEFSQVVFSDPAVKADAAVLQAILGNTFIPSMMQQGKVTKDDKNIYHVVK